MTPIVLVALLAVPDLDLLKGQATVVSTELPVVFSPRHTLLPAPSVLKSFQAGGYRVIPWTVNDEARMRALLVYGVDGIITDDPELLRRVLDSTAPDKVPRGFSSQGHRGARELRPENTLPSMEAALDARMHTREVDLGMTKDGVPMLGHDVVLEPKKARRFEGGYEKSRAMNDFTAAELQQDFVLDVLLADRPRQQNDRRLSPASVAFARERELKDAYTPASLRNLLDFVAFYARYYREGPGRSHPEAEARWKNAQQVELNLETKITPQWEQEGLVPPPAVFVRAVLQEVKRAGLSSRVMVQSFDPRTLVEVQKQLPGMRVAFLLGE